MSTGEDVERRGLAWRHQIALLVLFLVTLIVLGSLGAALAAARQTMESQSMERALTIARVVASDPRYAQWVTEGPPSVDGPVQRTIAPLNSQTSALYIVVTDTDGIRYSHPTPSLIGQRVSTDPSIPLAGGETAAIDAGTLGLAARGKVPLRARDGRVVGTVSVGIPMSDVDELQLSLLWPLIGIGGGAIALGFLGVWWVSGRLQRVTHGLEADEMADLLREHTAVLGTDREGLIATDAAGRVRVANDAARSLVGDPTLRPGTNEDALPAGLRALLSPGEGPSDAGQLVAAGDRILAVRRMPVTRGKQNLGQVLLLSDQTDLDDLSRQLEATRALTDALRAQSHEYSNRLHALAGMLHLGHYDDAQDYLEELSGSVGAVEGVQDPYLAGLIAAKTAVCSELGVELRITDATWVDGRLSAPLDAVTVVGNLIDNAARAAERGGRRPAWVEVSLLSDGADLVVHVVDSGDGVPEGVEDAVFADGWTTKPTDGRAHGIGLALARATTRRHGGDLTLASPRGTDHGAAFAARLPSIVAVKAEGVS